MSILDLHADRIGEPKVDTSFRSTIMAGTILLGGTLGAFGLWAGLAPLSSAAIAPGVVAVSGSNKQIQHLEGGLVKALHVREGDRVAAGQVLLELDPTKAASQVEILRGQLDSTLALEARLLAERDGSEQVEFPAYLLDRAANADVAAILNGQRTLFEARRNAQEGQITILQQRRAQALEQIGGLRSQAESQEEQLVLIKDELKGLKELLSKGYAPKTRILALEREASRLTGERGKLLGEIAQTQQVLGETDLQMIQVKKTFQEQVATELREAQIELYDLRERMRAAEDVLNRTTVVAPNSGLVVDMKVHTLGGVIPAGEPLMQIVPDQDELVVEAHLQVTDVDQVKIGMPADIKFSAFRQATTPVIHGEVTTVSADRLTDQRTGQPYYAVRITVPEEELRRLEGLQIMPGMPADAFIKTGEQTLFTYLLQPFTQVVERSFREH